MASRFTKIKMKVSIAGRLPDGAEFSYQPGQVVMVESDLAGKWLSVGHAERVDKDTPLTEVAALATNDYLEHDPRLLHVLQGYEPI